METSKPNLVKPVNRPSVGEWRGSRLAKSRSVWVRPSASSGWTAGHVRCTRTTTWVTSQDQAAGCSCGHERANTRGSAVSDRNRLSCIVAETFARGIA